MGGVTQMRMPPTVTRDEARATITQHMPTTMATREVGQAVYVQGPTMEEESAAQVTIVRQDQLVAGEMQQRVVLHG